MRWEAACLRCLWSAMAAGRCACEGDFRLSRIHMYWWLRMSGQRVAQRRKRSALWKRRAGALIDRSGGKIEFPVESNALIELLIESYQPDDCPLCRQGTVAVKPGSRFARSAS